MSCSTIRRFDAHDCSNDNTCDHIVALARRLFGEAGCQEALALVDQYGIEPHEPGVHLVKRNILELSDGKKTRLPYWM